MRILFILFIALALPVLVPAAVIYNVTLDTSPLMGSAAGPFALNFQLNDGSGANDGNNTAVLSNFQFGGGSASGSATLMGGVSGDLGTTVMLTDSAFLNSFTQSFMSGAALSFTLMLTTNPDAGGTPDQFSFSIQDQAGFDLPTMGLGMAGSDALILVDLSSANPIVQTFATDPTRLAAGSVAIAMDAPAVQAGAVPEPSSWLLMASGLVAAGVLRKIR